jgi:hypothetical protein
LSCWPGTGLASKDDATGSDHPWTLTKASLTSRAADLRARSNADHPGLRSDCLRLCRMAAHAETQSLPVVDLTGRQVRRESAVGLINEYQVVASPASNTSTNVLGHAAGSHFQAHSLFELLEQRSWNGASSQRPADMPAHLSAGSTSSESPEVNELAHQLLLALGEEIWSPFFLLEDLGGEDERGYTCGAREVPFFLRIELPVACFGVLPPGQQ